MKMLVIGGAGAMGRWICRRAVDSPAVHALTLTDLSTEVAVKTAAALDGPATGIGLDLTDADALRRALREVDVVVNAAGPFYRFGALVLEAAIAARCHYLDISDDTEPTLAMLALDGRARAAGITAIVGLGASPGVSNLLAVTAIRELDEVDRVVTGWALDGVADERSGAGPHAATLHGIRQMTGVVRTVREGRLAQERPLRRETIDYPGVGRRSALIFGHPEPATLLRSYPQIRDSVNVTHGSRLSMTVLTVMSRAVEHGLSVDRAARWIEGLERLHPAEDAGQVFRPQNLPPVFAWAQGRHDGRGASVGAALGGFPGDTMGAVTGTPVVVGVELLAEGSITRRGVFAPEAGVDPDAFFSALARYCYGSPDPREMTLVTRSWQPGVVEAYRHGVVRSLGRRSEAPGIPKK